MPRPKAGDRVIDVRGRRIRYVLGGRICSETCETETEAQTVAEKLRRDFAAEGHTIEGTIGAWLNYCRLSLKLGASTVDKYRDALAQIVPVSRQWEPLASLTPAKCQALYDAAVPRYAAATHHNALDTLKRWLKWAKSRKILQSNPAQEIEAIDRPKRGKKQLTEDEARKLCATAEAHLIRGKKYALLPFACLLLGTRISELLRRQVRDLDRDGTVLVIPFGKTPGAVRRLELPPELVFWMAPHCAGKAPGDLIFPTSRSLADYWVRALCKRAGVPVVGLHSLRGLHATLAVKEGQTPAVVARALGHRHQGVTERHYLQPGSVQQAQSDNVIRLIREKRQETPAFHDKIENSAGSPHRQRS
jgi:integrase